MEFLLKICLGIDCGLLGVRFLSYREDLVCFVPHAMRRFFQTQPLVRYRDCVLVYRHVYSRDRPERQKRDHDNIEVNMVSDIVALYVMPDDSPKVCAHYYRSVSGTDDRTEVYVVPKNDFPLWLVTERAMPDKGVELYETR